MSKKPASAKIRPQRPPVGEVLIWHLAWSLGVVAGGLVIALSGLTSAAIGALLLALIPPIAAQVLLKFDGEQARTLLLGLWSLCVAAACALAGGIGGPLSPWLLAPLGVAGVVGRAKMLAKGAAFSLTSVAGVFLMQAFGLVGPPIEGLLKAGLSALALLTTALGLAAGLILARRAGSEDSEARAALDAQPNLIVVTDQEGRALSTYGPAPQGVDVARLKEGLDRAGREADRPEINKAVAAVVAGEAAVAAFISAGDEARKIALDLRRLDDRRLIAVLRDTTAARDREQALENAASEAESLAAGRSRFLASMSHELRTPLNAIMGFSDVMRQKMFGELPGKYVEYADLIHESGSHLLDLINDVLDMSKIEAQRYELAVEAMDAREPVQAALRIVRIQADEASVHLRANLPSKPIDIDADRRAIKQMVLNLVSNAVKFTPADGSVTVSLSARGKELELVVADTGVGISEEDLKRIGRPYEQAGNADRKAQGTGLGLSLVRALAELHGGEMGIESRLGAGTAVTVRMPVVHEGGASENVVAFKPPR